MARGGPRRPWKGASGGERRARFREGWWSSEILVPEAAQSARDGHGLPARSTERCRIMPEAVMPAARLLSRTTSSAVRANVAPMPVGRTRERAVTGPCEIRTRASCPRPRIRPSSRALVRSAVRSIDQQAPRAVGVVGEPRAGSTTALKPFSRSAGWPSLRARAWPMRRPLLQRRSKAPSVPDWVT